MPAFLNRATAASGSPATSRLARRSRKGRWPTSITGLGAAGDLPRHRLEVVVGSQPRHRRDTAARSEVSSQDAGGLFGSPLAAVADLLHLDAGARRPGSDSLHRRGPTLGQRPFGVLVLRLRLAVLNKKELRHRGMPPSILGYLRRRGGPKSVRYTEPERGRAGHHRRSDHHEPAASLSA